MTVRLKLVCHASTSAVRSAAFPVDEPIDEYGRRDLSALSQGVLAADRVWAGPELRTAQTAAALGMKAMVEPLLRECDYGRWSGASLDAVQAREPDAIQRWMSDPDAAPHGGETVAAMVGRVAIWLEAQHATSGRVVAVTHASIIRAALVCALRADPRCFWRIDVAPLSVMSLSGHDGRWNLSSFEPLVPS